MTTRQVHLANLTRGEELQTLCDGRWTAQNVSPRTVLAGVYLTRCERFYTLDHRFATCAACIEKRAADRAKHLGS